MAQYELSSTLFKYLDRHLCFPLLEFLQDKGLYNEEDIMRAKIGLLQNTNMVDFAMDIHKELYGADVPEVMKKRREEVVSRLRTLQKAVQPIMACLSDPNIIRNFRPNPGLTAGFIQDPYGLSLLRLAAQKAFCSLPAMSMLKVGSVEGVGDAVVVGADAEVGVDDFRFSASLPRLEAKGLLAPNPPCWLSQARFWVETS